MALIISFCIFHCRNGNLRARKVNLVQPAKQEAFQGVICSMKENYGFIERADVVKEIFFHFSEFEGNVNEIVLGDDVEFNIQTRNVSIHTVSRGILFVIVIIKDFLIA